MSKYYQILSCYRYFRLNMFNKLLTFSTQIQSLFRDWSHQLPKCPIQKCRSFSDFFSLTTSSQSLAFNWLPSLFKFPITISYISVLSSPLIATVQLEPSFVSLNYYNWVLIDLPASILVICQNPLHIAVKGSLPKYETGLLNHYLI